MPFKRISSVTMDECMMKDAPLYYISVHIDRCFLATILALILDFPSRF